MDNELVVNDGDDDEYSTDVWFKISTQNEKTDCNHISFTIDSISMLSRATVNKLLVNIQ